MAQSKANFAVDQVLCELERAFDKDNTLLHTLDSTNVASVGFPSASGLVDTDYLQFSQLANGFKDLVQIKTESKTCIPLQILQSINRENCNFMMGIFPEIHRAWLTVNNDIFVWSYEQGYDVAYYDGINETIIGVGLVKPKQGVFKSFIKYLLVLTTAVEIIVLGVTFSNSEQGIGNEMNLVPDPIFQMSAEDVPYFVIKGSENGRIFLGGHDGCLYELSYQAKTRWFGKRCSKVNHSTHIISYILPSFINNFFYEEDAISQITIDNSRFILYTLSSKSTIEVFDLGADGQSMSQVAKISQSAIAQLAQQILNSLEVSNFKQIVGLSAIEENESKLIQLVATTQTGFRLYFTVYDNAMLPAAAGTDTQKRRPNMIRLVHVRLPPGFSANFHSILPKNISFPHFKRSNFVFVSSNAVDQSTLWCVNADPFPANNTLSESYTTIAMDAPVWDLTEVDIAGPDSSHLFVGSSLPPLLVRQHAENPRKYIALTSQSVYVLTKSRPIDFLRQLLLENKGADNPPVKAYFQIQGEEQACAICLVLACLEQTQQHQIADWAIRAFLMYGGTAVNDASAIPGHSSYDRTFVNASQFMPNLASTPAEIHFSDTLQSSIAANNFNRTQTDVKKFSAKHNGLYLYASRILRPLWYMFCVKKVFGDDDNPDNFYIVSSISNDDLNLVLNNLLALKNFLVKYYTHWKSTRDLQQAVLFNKTLNTATAVTDRLLIEQQIEENKSIENLHVFIGHCSEIISLWKILNQHQFSELVESLSTDSKTNLLSTTFKELFLFGREISSMLILNLINSYLKVGASIDSITKKLCDDCPNLFNTQDAISSKASQLLIKAKLNVNLDEKEELISRALNMYKEVAPNINLPMAVQKFIANECYSGIVDLCVTCSSRVDPENLALRYYKNNEPDNDKQGYCAYVNKLNFYNEIVQLLENLFNRNLNNDTSNDLKTVFKIIGLALQQTDEILHIVIYDWMFKKKLYSDIINIKNDSLETFLLKSKEQNPDSVDIHDLLWKFYEKMSNHLQATIILKNLAHSSIPNIDLSKRIEYLSRAVICAKCCQATMLLPYAIHIRDLEDEVDIARCQRLILEAVQKLDIQESERKTVTQHLNMELLKLTTLYNEYADQYDLWECKLALMSYSTNANIVVIKQIWSKILDVEKEKVAVVSDTNEKIVLVLDKIRQLYRIYQNNKMCFPLEFILLETEIWSCNLKGNVSLVPCAFLQMAINPDELIAAYNQIFTLNQDIWATDQTNFHIFYAFVELLNLIKEDLNNYLVNHRLRIATKAEDTVLAMLSYLYGKPNTDDIIKKMRSIRADFGSN